jgi:AraC family transcriptional regulator
MVSTGTGPGLEFVGCNGVAPMFEEIASHETLHSSFQPLQRTEQLHAFTRRAEPELPNPDGSDLRTNTPAAPATTLAVSQTESLAPVPWTELLHPGDTGPSGHGILFRGPQFTIGFTRCCPHDPGKSCTKCIQSHALTFIRRGVFEYFTSRTSALADPTTVLFGKANEEFRTSHPGCIGDETMVLTPTNEMLRETLQAIDPKAAENPDGIFDSTTAPCTNRTFLLHRRVFDLARQPEIDRLELDEATQELLVSVLSESVPLSPSRAKAVRANTVRAHAEISEAARRILSSEFSQRVMLNDIARRVHTAPFHLCRIFRTHTGMTVHKYLTRIRVRAAVEMLASTSEPLQTIALRVGLCSQSHLCDAFRRELGLSPAKIRRALGDSLRWTMIREATGFQSISE